MGESANNVLGMLKSFFQIDALWANIIGLKNFIPASVLELYQTHTVIFNVSIACVLILLAFEGYKLFKMALYAGSAILFSVIGFWYVAPIIPANIKGMVPGIVEFDVLVAILFALIAFFICKCAHGLMIMGLGGAVGYLVGSTYVYGILLAQFNTLPFISLDVTKHIVGGVIGMVMVPLFVLLFKHVFIVGTSIGCNIGAFAIILKSLVPAADQNVNIAAVILAVALGVYAIIHQYKEEEKAMEIVF